MPVRNHLDPDRLARARDFMVRNARLLDRHLFACLFDDASPQPALDALGAYRNPDAGFGHALEPDKRCPDSQPVDAEVALGILDLIGAFDDPMVSATCDWLERNADASGGLAFAFPSVNAYPHAPWWRTDANPRPWINPTGSIIAMLTKWRIDHPWVARGTAFCWHFLETEQPTGFDNIRCALAFLEQAQDRERAAAWLEKARHYLLSSNGDRVRPQRSRLRPPTPRLGADAERFWLQSLPAPRPCDRSGRFGRGTARGRRLAHQVASDQPGR